MKKEKILIVAAHPDDEVLGCGGVISKYRKTCEFSVIFMTNGVSSRSGSNKNKILARKNACLKLFRKIGFSKPIFFNFPDNQMDKVPMLKIVKKLESKIKDIKPNTIFTHYSQCLNIDHRKTFEAVITACRPLSNKSVKKILSFEIPSSTDWAIFKGKNFQPNYYIDISKHIKNKLNYIKFYKEELRKYPHSRSLNYIKSLASVRGANCGVNFAEVFYLNRYLD